MIDSIPSDNQSITKSGKISKTRIAITIGVLLTMLFFNFGVVSATNSTDLNVTSVPTVLFPVNTLIPDTTLIPSMTIITPVPTSITNVTTTQPEPEPSMINNTTATMTPIPTTQVPATSLITAVQNPSPDPTLIRTLRPSSEIDQYTLRAGKRVSQAEKEKAAENYKPIREAYLLQGNAGLPTMDGTLVAAPNAPAATALDPGGVPHYFGPYPNWANSPMPMGRIANITVDSGGTGYTAPVITITDVYFTGNGAAASATVVGGVITNITVLNPGSRYTAPVVIIQDTTGTGAAATANMGGPFTSGIRKFVDTMPGLNSAQANNLGSYIPVAIPDTVTYPGSDYYEIELGEFTQKMHSDLPNTTLRGYRQTNTLDPNVSQFENHRCSPYQMVITVLR